MYRLFIPILLLTSSLLAQNINIAVAANVSYAMNDLIKTFNQNHPDIKIKMTLGSSGKLTAQIKHGAPYDLFMSANMNYPQALYEQNLAISKPVVYAQGSLAILSSKAQDFTNNISMIASNNIKRIAIANPKTAPYGKATIEALKNKQLYNNIKRKLIYGESIAQTVAYTLSAADIGFIAKSSLYSPKMQHYKKNIHWIDVDSTLYTPINQGLVLLKKAKEKKEAKAFYDFLLSYEAQQILKQFGYLIP